MRSLFPVDAACFAVAFVIAGAQACAPREVVLKAADVVNEVAKRGDQVDATAVEACAAAERVAAELPDLDEAERSVKEIRARCDVVFRAIDRVELAINTVDATMAKFEEQRATVADLVDAALAARQTFDDAASEAARLRTYLESIR